MNLEPMVVTWGLMAVLGWRYILVIEIQERRQARLDREARARGEVPQSDRDEQLYAEAIEALAREVLRRSRPRSRF
jgi:hypothetical protein